MVTVGRKPSGKASSFPRRLDTEEVAAFLSVGYTRAQILEVIVGIAFKTLSNFTNHLADTPIDKQFASFEWEPAGAAQGPA